MSDGPAWFDVAALDRGRWRALVEPMLEMAGRALERDRFPHALMLSGPAGMGRELAAAELAAMLICAEPRPWSGSAAAERVRSGLHPDVALLAPPIDPKTTKRRKHIVIEQIRELVESAPSRPYEGRVRLWIVAGAERGELGDEAANAFLKLLEEPPPHCRFLLLVGNPDRVLPTIRSRCQLLTLPGPLAAAQVLGTAAAGPELATTEDEAGRVEAALAAVREALDAGSRGELEPLLRLPAELEERLAGGSRATGIERRAALVRGFELVAAVALELAAAAGAGDRGEDLVRLAQDALERSRRVLALNLDSERQLLAALMTWFEATSPSSGLARE